MTWEELKAKAKEMGDTEKECECVHIYKNEVDFYFYNSGTLAIKDGYDNTVVIGNLTPDKMWQIMEALR